MSIVENGVLIITDNADIERLNNGETWEAVFGVGITKIGDKAFYGKKNLKWELTLPASITAIGNYAFMGCENLTGRIPDNLISIGKLSFSLSGLEEKEFYYGRRNEEKDNNWEVLDLKEIKVSRPIILVFGGSGTVDNKAANGNVKIIHSLLGVFKDDVDVIGLNYGNAIKTGERSINEINKLLDQVFMPLISNDKEKLTTNQACKNMRNITIVAHCFGDHYITKTIVEELAKRLEKLGYSIKERSTILEQIFMVSYAANRDSPIKSIKAFSVVSSFDESLPYVNINMHVQKTLTDKTLKMSLEDKERIAKIPAKNIKSFYSNNDRLYIFNNSENEISVISSEINHNGDEHSMSNMTRSYNWKPVSMATKTGDYTSRCFASALCYSVANSILNQRCNEFLPIDMVDLRDNLENIVKPLNFEGTEFNTIILE